MSRVLLTFSCPLDHAPLPRPPLVSGRQGQQYYKGGPAYQAYKSTLRAAANEQWDDRPPYDGPSEIRIVVEFAEARRPASRQGETWHLKPPDSDNLLKPIQDALTGLCFSDDRTVTVQRVAKIWGPEDRVTVQLRAHTPNDLAPLTDRQAAYLAAGVDVSEFE